MTGRVVIPGMAAYVWSRLSGGWSVVLHGLRTVLSRRTAMAWGACVCVMAGALGMAGQAVAQAPVTYGSRNACEMSSRFTREQCDNAFANALAEFDEGTPRFPKRDECEKRFGRCQIAGFGSGKVSFGPQMDGVVIATRAGNITVLPVLKGPRAPVPFAERTILQRKTERSDRKQKAAQARWEALWSAPEGVPPPEDGTAAVPSPGGPEPFDENWQKQEGVAKYPAPPSRVKKPAQ